MLEVAWQISKKEMVNHEGMQKPQAHMVIQLENEENLIARGFSN